MSRAPDPTGHARVVPRPPDQVMRLERMGSFHQSRLSFMRILLRRLRAENWRFTRPLFDIDARGVGRALYSAHGPERTYTLVAFGHDLPPDMRSDRVIAEAWDATFTLFDGTPTETDLQRLARNVPLQEAGRITETELTLARANRSVRLFEHVVDRLAQGEQPDEEAIEAVGYLMRTTAVYGSGKFGAADRENIAGRPECAAPFQAEMLTVYLIRNFVMDLAEHMARLRNPSATVLRPDLRRRFGIGNSTGLGMAPFLINHPLLLHNWMAAREEALARVRALPVASETATEAFRDRCRRADWSVRMWRSDHPVQNRKLALLRADMDLLTARLAAPDALSGTNPWDQLYRWGEDSLSVEGQELLVSLLMEPHGRLVDDLHTRLSADESGATRIDGAMPLDRLRSQIKHSYGWALAIDWTTRDAQARAWYVSAEKLEPRLGERFEEPIAAYEQPLCPGRDVAALYDALPAGSTETVAAFLMRAPEHRHAVRRVQLVARCPYSEIRDNTIAADLLPIDMLRCKLSFFGAGHFDPRSDRWVRINMYQGAPFPHELAAETADDWIYPPRTRAVTHSLNETEALCRKAARGAGYDWGLAEEAGRSVRWLQAHGLDGAACLADWLDDRDGAAPCISGHDWRGVTGPLCPLITGAALSDHATSLHAPLAIAPLRHPLLLVPFAAQVAARHDRVLRLTWPGVRIDLSAHGPLCQADPATLVTAGPVTLTLALLEASLLQDPPPLRRADLDPAVLRRLEAFAQRTYAPATEASRVAGAGAGLTDND